MLQIRKQDGLPDRPPAMTQKFFMSASLLRRGHGFADHALTIGSLLTFYSP
jgi:hypothetical protein